MGVKTERLRFKYFLAKALIIGAAVISLNNATASAVHSPNFSTPAFLPASSCGENLESQTIQKFRDLIGQLNLILEEVRNGAKVNDVYAEIMINAFNALTEAATELEDGELSHLGQLALDHYHSRETNPYLPGLTPSSTIRSIDALIESHKTTEAGATSPLVNVRNNIEQVFMVNLPLLHEPDEREEIFSEIMHISWIRTIFNELFRRHSEIIRPKPYSGAFASRPRSR